MEIFDLKASPRKGTGKGEARKLRRQGMLPAVLYGPEIESILLTISALDLENIYKESGREHVVLNLIIQNGGTQEKTVVIRETQTSPLFTQYLHVDFYEISLEEELAVNVPVELTGKSKGVERGGLMQVVRHELEVSCLPADIPAKIEADISHLDIGDSLHIEDIVVGEKVRLLYDSNFTVATVVAPTVEEEEVLEEELEEAAEEEAAEAEAAEEAADE